MPLELSVNSTQSVVDHSDVFNSNLDGGVSLFINPTDKMDYLRRPGNLLIIVPQYRYCILRGNGAHNGTGNSTDDAVFKFFCFVDPVRHETTSNEDAVKNSQDLDDDDALHMPFVHLLLKGPDLEKQAYHCDFLA